MREVQRVAKATMAAFHRVAALLVAAEVATGKAAAGAELWLGGERLRVGRIKTEIASVLAEHRLAQPEGGIVAPAEESAIPHSTGSDGRVLRTAQSLVVDLYPKGGLFADCCRTFCVGEPPAELATAHATVSQALSLSHRLCHPGVRGWTLQEAVCEHMAKAGYPSQISDPEATRGYVHGLGHGVGYEVHELPFFTANASPREGMLEAGDVFTLEPGLYDPQAGYGVRLEDLCTFTGETTLNLTPLPYSLDPRAWSSTEQD
jgi:Xaa-Pro aminopeptidase